MLSIIILKVALLLGGLVSDKTAPDEETEYAEYENSQSQRGDSRSCAKEEFAKERAPAITNIPIPAVVIGTAYSV